MIYLDAAATTKPKTEVIDVMIPYLAEQWYNPSALYSNANKVKTDIENARKTVGDFINADAKEIYFTSGGSESNCWAIQGFVNHCIATGEEPCVITSLIEHKSLLECIDHLNNVDVHYIGVDREGYIDTNSLNNLLHHIYHTQRACKILVSLQFANNEIGTIQHIKEIAEIVHKYKAVFHTDAVQAFGHIEIDVKELGIDMMSVSGHKIGCPKGIGFLYKKSNIDINPLIYGSQMDGLRGGTENVPYIIGMAKAVELIQKGTDYRLRMDILRNAFIRQLISLGWKINGSLYNRLPNNINVTFNQNTDGESFIYLLDTCGIMASTGSACNSHSIEHSNVLMAIGLNVHDAIRTIRMTLPDDITMDQIDKVISEIKKITLLLSEGDSNE